MTVESRIVDGPLPPAALFRVAGAGAVLTFDGVVRPNESGQPITGLYYQTYDPMAAQQLRKLAEATAAQHELLGLRVIHSRGWVPAGECSFQLQVASQHRGVALAAISWFIDHLKQDVPIWKLATDAGPTAGREP